MSSEWSCLFISKTPLYIFVNTDFYDPDWWSDEDNDVHITEADIGHFLSTRKFLTTQTGINVEPLWQNFHKLSFKKKNLC